MQINHPAPDFELPDLDGQLHRLRNFRGRIIIICFWSAECPHVSRADASFLTALERWGKEIVLLTIASNANESMKMIKNASHRRKLPIVLMDMGQQVADTYQAQVTPEVFVIDREGIIRYHGAMDEASIRQHTPGRLYPVEAVDSLLAGNLPVVAEVPAFGCSIIREPQIMLE